MDIIINTNELVRSIRETFLQEISGIDESILNAKSSGPISEAEFERAIITADSSVRDSLFRFISPESSTKVKNTHSLPTDIIYSFTGSLRRFAGKGSILASAIHDSLKEAALGGLLSSLNPELAQRHNEGVLAGIAQIQKIIYTKNPPL